MNEPKQVSPHTEVLHHLIRANTALRQALPIAEALPNHGSLYAEIKDAAGIINQSITFVLAESDMARQIELAAAKNPNLRPEATITHGIVLR